MDREGLAWVALGLAMIATFVAVLILLEGAVAAVLPWTLLSPPPWTLWPGGGMAGIGFGLVSWSSAAFGYYGHGTPLPLLPPQRLVTRGPYRHVRNPIYLGWLLGFGGLALAAGRLAFLGIGLTLFTVAVLVGRLEARSTAGRLGPEYRRWVERTPAFLPRRRR